MTRPLVKLLVTSIAILGAVSAFGQSTVPTNIGRWFEQSTSGSIQSLRDGCRWRYDPEARALACSKEILVTLGGGKATTVSNASVKATSRVSCGCQGQGAGATLKCSKRATWLARYSVESVANGSFVLAHSYARGDGSEQIVCEIG